MATSSKFLLLSSSVLMEYRYADRSAINTPGNEFQISTAAYPLWKTQNLYTGEAQILNSDSSEQVVDGQPQGTGNVRDRSFAFVGPHKAALLDIDKVTFFNDYDAKLTPTASLPIVFTNPKAPVYDTIRLHLVQGFNFENHSGLTLTVKCRDLQGTEIVLANVAYMRNDFWETLNPSSFFFAGRVYDSYLEFRVLSLYDLIQEYWLGTLDGDTVVERITDGVGLQRSQHIQTSFSWVREKRKIDDQDYIDLFNTVDVDVPVRDQFETIAAYIAMSTTGDYAEFYATHNGDVIENYILDLNRSGGDYVVLHDIVFSEYVLNVEDQTYNWIKTSDLQLSQTDDFDLPNLYRPIVKNGAAIAFKIEYVARLFNRVDQTQVWKAASMVSYEAAKYGRKMLSINLGANPPQSKVYNKIVTKEVKVNRIAEPVLDRTRYITSFIDSNAISVSFQTVGPQPQQSLVPTEPGRLVPSASSSRVYPNGMARIFIPDTVSYLRFVLHREQDGVNSMLNLHGLGDMVLTFASGKGDVVEVEEFPDLAAQRGAGEVVFRLTEAQSKQILGLDDRTFKMFARNEKGEKTFIYAGKFFSVDEFQDLAEADKITSLEETIAAQLSTIASLNSLSTSQQGHIEDLMTQVTQLSSSLSSDEDLINSLKNTIRQLNTKLMEITRRIKESSDDVSNSINRTKPLEKDERDSIRPSPRPNDKGQSFFESEITKNRSTVGKSGSSPYTARPI